MAVYPLKLRHKWVIRSHWWRHQMEPFSALLVLCEENPPVDSPNKGQWRGALMFSLICAWTKRSANNRDAGDLRRHRHHYDVTVMKTVNDDDCYGTRASVSTALDDTNKRNFQSSRSWMIYILRLFAIISLDMSVAFLRLGLLGQRDIVVACVCPSVYP